MEEAVKRNIDKMLRTALAITHSKQDAEDAVQDAFVKLFEKQPRFAGREHETSWLIRVTVNLCKNHLKSSWRKNAVELLDVYPAENSTQRELMEVVQSLPAKYRLVIHLFYFEGYSTKEIARLTKQKDSTVRQQLTRARQQLKQFLTEEEDL
jgi:RNA polymerase sigma-70 factor (ECF subfamily)